MNSDQVAVKNMLIDVITGNSDTYLDYMLAGSYSYEDLVYEVSRYMGFELTYDGEPMFMFSDMSRDHVIMWATICSNYERLWDHALLCEVNDDDLYWSVSDIGIGVKDDYLYQAHSTAAEELYQMLLEVRGSSSDDFSRYVDSDHFLDNSIPIPDISGGQPNPQIEMYL